jgi:hypothetical protein
LAIMINHSQNSGMNFTITPSMMHTSRKETAISLALIREAVFNQPS